jgi:hypothetical protein
MRYLIVLSAIAFALGTVSIASTPAEAKGNAKAAKPAAAATAETRAPARAAAAPARAAAAPARVAAAPARVAADTKSPMCKVIVPDQFLTHHRDYYRCW